ncbi:MAG: HEPN domain-containing protein [bacterium]
MEENIKILIQKRLEKAKEDIETTQELFKTKRYRALANRAYYAVFAITNAILLTKKIERVKHSGIESAFNQFFVKTGIFPKECGQIYKFLRKQREDSDYKFGVIKKRLRKRYLLI